MLAMWKLKEFFHVANLHWNNFACNGGTPPFRSWAYEILFVNKRMGVPATGTTCRSSQSAGSSEHHRLDRLPGSNN